MVQKTVQRVTLTKGQAASAAGAQLLALLVEFTADGELSLGEVERLRVWLAENNATDVPAVAWLRELVADVLTDGRVTSAERVGILLAIERVMPKDQRVIASARRKAAAEVAREDEFEDKRYEVSDGSDYGSATEPQRRYILALGGKVTTDMSISEASELIDRLLSSSSSVSNRQMMVLRFWNRVEVSREGRHAVSEWMDVWYAEDPDRQAAWTLWKEDNGDVGRQDNPEKVPLGVGDNYLWRVKNGGASGSSFVVRLFWSLVLLCAMALGVAFALARIP